MRSSANERPSVRNGKYPDAARFDFKSNGFRQCLRIAAFSADLHTVLLPGIARCGFGESRQTIGIGSNRPP
jgi:hypothetical protein